MGALVHAVAVEHLRRGAAFETSSLRETTDALLSPTLEAVYRMAARQRVITALIVYGRELIEPSWEFFEGEHISIDVKLDLLWLRPGGTICADEIKTGLAASLNMPAIARQCSMQCLAGRDEFGELFSHVRLVLIPERKVGVMSAEKVGEFSWL